MAIFTWYLCVDSIFVILTHMKSRIGPGNNGI